MEKYEIDKVLLIGKEELDVNLIEFLPHLPRIRGSESILRLRRVPLKMDMYDIIQFVRGLHFIEMCYKKEVENDFGFGSPSPTFKMIKSLHKYYPGEADNIYTWNEERGGNYYIPRNKLK